MHRRRLLRLAYDLTLIVGLIVWILYGYVYAALIVALAAGVFVYSFFWTGFRGLHRFARAWKEQHQNPPSTVE
jgi:Flp pilus assembly protein TadB